MGQTMSPTGAGVGLVVGEGEDAGKRPKMGVSGGDNRREMSSS